MKNLRFTTIGILFGIIMTKSEAISWFRIQEMFRFQSFHMYGIISTAILFGMLVVWVFKKFNIHTVYGDPITFKPKDKSYKRYILGGSVFGLGWALTGACPGPLYTLVGSGFVVLLVSIASAIVGTYIYGFCRDKWPKTFS
jgi:uncharacterized membrane protein YedE/YeeE